ncbi:MAG: hypothetical protein ACJ746_00125 [Bryobacteraceae bacterium]
MAIGNDLPGVIPVVKFTRREIAFERMRTSVHAAPSTEPKKEARVPFRDGSEAARVYALLWQAEGATTYELQELNGWQRPVGI